MHDYAATGKFTTLEGEELMASMRSVEGVSVVATVNEDGSPNAAVFVPMMPDEDHVVMTLAKNHTRENVERTGRCALVYDVVDPTAEEKSGRHRGARLHLELVPQDSPEHAEVAERWPHMTPFTLVFRITQLDEIG